MVTAPRGLGSIRVPACGVFGVSPNRVFRRDAGTCTRGRVRSPASRRAKPSQREVGYFSFSRRSVPRCYGVGSMASSLNVNDLIINRSDRSGVEELSVTIHEYPANVPSSFTPARAAYSFWYRPRTEKGDTWVTVPELGLSHHHISRGHVLVAPPSLPVHGEWERADGIVVNFSFSPGFFRGSGRTGGSVSAYFKNGLGIISLRSISGLKRCAGS